MPKQPNSRDRLGALETLCNLDPLVLAQQDGGVADALGDTDWRVRFWSVNTLGELQIHILTKHAGAIAEILKDADWHLRAWAIKTLGNLEQRCSPSTPKQLPCCSGTRFLLHAMRRLNKLEPVELTKHAASIVPMFGDSNTDVRYTAVETLGKLETATRTQLFFGKHNNGINQTHL